MEYIKVKVVCSVDPETEIEFLVDPSESLVCLLPLFWRRFGVNGGVDFIGCAITGVDGKRAELDLDCSLLQSDGRFMNAATDRLWIETRESSQSRQQLDESVSDGDLNIWEEPEDCADNILLSEGPDALITAGTLNKLVEKLTAGDDDGIESSQCKYSMMTLIIAHNRVRFELYEDVSVDFSEFYFSRNSPA